MGGLDKARFDGVIRTESELEYYKEKVYEKG